MTDPANDGPRPPSPTHRHAVSYIDKSREYYAASGYNRPYRWATNTDAPFTPLTGPLASATVGLVTTSSLVADDGDGPADEPKRVYAAPTDPAPERMFTMDLSWDKQATNTDDVETFLPIRRLRELEASGRIGRLADRFYGVPTEYSQRRTAEDAVAIEQWCREDDVDVVLLVPL